MRCGVLLAFLLTAAAAHAQEPRFADELDVEVVSVDVVATAEDGTPVADLTAEDFEVLDGGLPVRPTHFARVGREGQVGAIEPGEPLHLILLFDDAQIPPADRTAAYEGVRRQLDRLLAAADRILVARQGAGIRIVQPFTSDRALLDAAIERLEKDPPGVPSNISARKAVLDEIRSGDAPSATALGSGMVAQGGQMQSNAELAAGTSLASVRAFAERYRSEVVESLGSLERLVAALAGLPGRKAVLLLGPGYDLRPDHLSFSLQTRPLRGLQGPIATLLTTGQEGGGLPMAALAVPSGEKGEDGRFTAILSS
ncbi:MAG TPA: VWA domain-containing protein [Thermoanaerobaculia bacterium]|nr:VWA domain-containing protein [Thermoanaerobaculia bacterium]